MGNKQGKGQKKVQDKSQDKSQDKGQENHQFYGVKIDSIENEIQNIRKQFPDGCSAIPKSRIIGKMKPKELYDLKVAEFQLLKIYLSEQNKFGMV